MVYNVTKVYVLNNQVLYVDEGAISRDSYNYNLIEVITNVSGWGVEVAFELPNGVFSDRLGMTQQVGTFVVPSDITELSSVAGEEWSKYQLLIPNAVLSAITATTSQTLGFSLRFSQTLNEGEDDEYTQAYTTEKDTLAVQGTIGGEPVALDNDWYQNNIVSDLNSLISLYNAINSAITDETTGLDEKVNKSGDTMTGELAFASASATRLDMGNNDISTTGKINTVTFSVPSTPETANTSDAVRYTELKPLLDNERDRITQNENDIADLETDKVEVSTYTSKVNEIEEKLSSLEGAYVFRGVVSENTSEVEADKSVLTTFITTNESRSPILGDVLKDSDGNEWYYKNETYTDDNGWVYMGTAFIDTYTKTEIDNKDNSKIDLDGENSALTVLNFVNGTTANVTYNSDAQVLEIDTPDGTTLQVGGELWFANGKASGSIANGDLVQFAGVQGDHYLLKSAVTSEINANPDLFVGIATHQADNNDWVKATWFGEVYDVSTNGWNVGDILYFDNVNGGLTNVKPTTKPIIQVAAVTKVETAPSANNGRLLVRPQFISRNAKEIFLEDTGDVFTSDNLEDALQEIPTIISNAIDNVDALRYIGVFDAANASEFPSGDKGDLYKVSSNGVVDGVDLEVGDIIICNTDGTVAGETANWDVIEGGFDQSLFQDHLDSTSNPHNTSLSNLTDTTITSPITNHALVHDGTNWKNRALSSSDVGLGSVQNYNIATTGEIDDEVAGDNTYDNRYMTPNKAEYQINKPRATKYFTDTVTIQYDSDDDSINFTFGV